MEILAGVGTGLITGGIQKPVNVGGVVGFELEDPGPVGITIDEIRCIVQRVVEGNDFSGDGRIDIRGGLDRLHDPCGGTGSKTGSK